jgi:hypothetical protein
MASLLHVLLRALRWAVLPDGCADAPPDDGRRWTCVVTCRACGSELRCATHVPTAAKPAMEATAPYIAVCASCARTAPERRNLRFAWTEED